MTVNPVIKGRGVKKAEQASMAAGVTISVDQLEVGHGYRMEHSSSRLRIHQISIELERRIRDKQVLVGRQCGVIWQSRPGGGQYSIHDRSRAGDRHAGIVASVQREDRSSK